MADAFIGEIRIFAGNFAPRNWALCQGNLLSIAQNTALFSLLGTTYGGNGQTTFALPDFRGRAPVHQGTGPSVQGMTIGEAAGTEQVPLLPSQMPAHTHPPRAATQLANTGLPTGNVVADTTANGALVYRAPGTPVGMSIAAIEPVGASAPHENRMPYLAMSFIICVAGSFPSRN